MYQGKRIVALLPMKAHSERVAGKNFRNLAGQPLYRWILDTLLSLKFVDLVVINTDAREILKEQGLAEDERVKIRDRRNELCGDFTSMNLILMDDIESEPADIYLMTHTTNPFLGADTIRDALEKFLHSKAADSLFTVNKYQSRFYKQDLTPVNHDPANLVRTQDLEPWYEENSCLYIFTSDSFSRMNARIGERPMFYKIPKLESIDIDTSDDWGIAQLIAEGIQRRKT